MSGGRGGGKILLVGWPWSSGVAAGISPQWAPFPEVFHDTGNQD